MAIALNAETESLLEARINSGDYRTADDVVRAALRALEQLESGGLDEATLKAIDEAEDDIETGQVHDWNTVRDAVLNRFLGKE